MSAERPLPHQPHGTGTSLPSEGAAGASNFAREVPAALVQALCGVAPPLTLFLTILRLVRRHIRSEFAEELAQDLYDESCARRAEGESTAAIAERLLAEVYSAGQADLFPETFQAAGEVAEAGDDSVICWLDVEGELRVKTDVPWAFFGNRKVEPGSTFQISGGVLHQLWPPPKRQQGGDAADRADEAARVAARFRESVDEYRCLGLAGLSRRMAPAEAIGGPIEEAPGPAPEPPDQPG